MALSVGSGTGTGAESSGKNTALAVAGSVCWEAAPSAVAPVNTGASTTARATVVKARLRRINSSARSRDQPGTEPENGAANKLITLADGDFSQQHSRPNPMQADFSVRWGIAPIVAGLIWLLPCTSAATEAQMPRGDKMLADYFRAETAHLREHCLADIKTLDDSTSRREKY